MTHLIGLSGYARSGKDTVAGILLQQGWQRHAFADKLKLAVLTLNPLINPGGFERVAEIIRNEGPEFAKDNYEEYRRLLQVFGTEVGRNLFGENFWVEQALREVREDEKAVFTDCRFPNEAQAIKDRGGEVWRIVRPGFGPVNNHPSETSLDEWEFDCYVYNDSDTRDLSEKINFMTTGFVA